MGGTRRNRSRLSAPLNPASGQLAGAKSGAGVAQGHLLGILRAGVVISGVVQTGLQGEAWAQGDQGSLPGEGGTGAETRRQAGLGLGRGAGVGRPGLSLWQCVWSVDQP